VQTNNSAIAERSCCMVASFCQNIRLSQRGYSAPNVASARKQKHWLFYTVSNTSMTVLWMHPLSSMLK